MWRARPVFVSSTFRDMQAERGRLRDVVAPVLAERLRERRHHLELIDLRWGIETSGAADSEQRELIVLKVCLDEIRRSRPFLIVLLGDRYGWAPPQRRMEAAAHEAGIERELEGKSVTALEIEFGALASPEQRRRTHFYFRAPLPYDRMSAQTAAVYSDERSPEPGAKDAHGRLERLKALIRTDPRWEGRRHEYAATWDAEAERVTGLEEWATQVIEHVWTDLDAETREFFHEKPTTWQEREREALAEFVAHHERGFRGREVVARELEEFALSTTTEGRPWGLSLTGESGSGKSALVAHLFHRLQSRDAFLLVHAAGISVRSTQVDFLLVRWIGELAAFLEVPYPLGENPSADELQDTWSGLLARAAYRKRVVVLLDALNEFETTTRAQFVTWLPRDWPANARLIVTSIPGTASETLERRSGVVARLMLPITATEAADIARETCGRYHWTVNDAVLRVLVAKKRDDGRPASANPLWLQLALEELNLLDEDEFARLDRQFQGTPDERLHQLLLEVAERIPAETADLYGWMIERAGEVWGGRWARAFAELVAISRTGLRELDFRALLPKLTGEAWDPLRFAGLRRAFRGHLVQRGLQEQWDFLHAQTRDAVRRTHLSDTTHERELHTVLADHLLGHGQDDPLREQETMFHLIAAGDRRKAAAYYRDAVGAPALTAATAALARHITATENDAGGVGLKWVLAMLDQPGEDPTGASALWNRFMVFLLPMMESSTRIETRHAVVCAIRDAARVPVDESDASLECLRVESLVLALMHDGDLCWAEEHLENALAAYREALHVLNSPESLIDEPLATRIAGGLYERIGNALDRAGDSAGTLDAYHRFVDLAQTAVEREPEKRGVWHDLSGAYQRLGTALLDHGDLADALDACRQSRDIALRQVRKEPGHVPALQRLSQSHLTMGMVLAGMGRHSEALDEYGFGSAINADLLRTDPTSANYARDLFVLQQHSAEALHALGRTPEAVQTLRKAIAAEAALVEKDPGSARRQSELADAYRTLSVMLRDQGAATQAMEELGTSLTISDRLAASDPGNTQWQWDIGLTWHRMADLCASQNALDYALEGHRRAAAVLAPLVTSAPEKHEWVRDLATVRRSAAAVLLRLGRSSEALGECRAALTLYGLLAVKPAADPHLRYETSVTQGLAGDALLSLNDPAGALEEYMAGQAIAEALVADDPKAHFWQRHLAVSHSNLGAYFDSQPGCAKQATMHWTACRDILRGMRSASGLLDEEVACMLEQLERRLG